MKHVKDVQIDIDICKCKFFQRYIECYKWIDNIDTLIWAHIVISINM